MKTNILEFYVNKFNYFDNIDDLDLSNIPPVVRRRMSTLDKVTLLAIDKTYTDSIQNIVFASQYGEVDRLLKIIDQYTKEKEVSPNTFSGSVHNYPVSFFLLNKKLSVPYTALSACKNTISSGLLVSLVSNYNNVLICYSDVNNDVVYAMAIGLSKVPITEGCRYEVRFQQNNNSDDSFDNYVKLFSGIISSVKAHNYTIERLDK